MTSLKQTSVKELVRILLDIFFLLINIIVLGFDEIWSKLEKSGKIIRCRICGLNKHQDFFATLVNHIRKDHLP